MCPCSISDKFCFTPVRAHSNSRVLVSVVFCDCAHSAGFTHHRRSAWRKGGGPLLPLSSLPLLRATTLHVPPRTWMFSGASQTRRQLMLCLKLSWQMNHHLLRTQTLWWVKFGRVQFFREAFRSLDTVDIGRIYSPQFLSVYRLAIRVAMKDGSCSCCSPVCCCSDHIVQNIWRSGSEVRYIFIQIAKKQLIQKHFHPRNHFIQKRRQFHPMTISSQTIFIQP